MKSLHLLCVAVCLITLLTTTACSQVVWKLALGSAPSNSLTLEDRLIETFDGNIVVAINQTVKEGVNNIPIVLVLKVTPNGDTLWTRLFHGKYGVDVRGIYERDNGDIVVGGDERIRNYSSPENDWQPMLLVLRSNGDSLWTTTYGAPNYDPQLGHNNINHRFISVTSTNDGHSLIMNRILGHHYIYKVDAIGRVVDMKFLDMQGRLFGDFHRTSDTTVYIPFGYNGGISILNVTNNGDSSSTTQLFSGEGSRYNYLTEVLQASGGGYFAVGWTSWNKRGTDKRSLYLYWKDSSGQVLDTLFNPDRFYDVNLEPFAIVAVSRGGYAIATSDTSSIWLTDRTGQTITKYVFQGMWISHRLIQLRDGGLVIVGHEVVNGKDVGMVLRVGIDAADILESRNPISRIMTLE